MVLAVGVHLGLGGQRHGRVAWLGGAFDYVMGDWIWDGGGLAVDYGLHQKIL
jgi:hypothetical protein